MASVHDSAISSRGPAVKSKEWTNARAAGTLGLVVEYTKRTGMILSEPMRRAVVGRMVLVARTAKGEVAEGAERCLLHPGCVRVGDRALQDGCDTTHLLHQPTCVSCTETATECGDGQAGQEVTVPVQVPDKMLPCTPKCSSPRPYSPPPPTHTQQSEAQFTALTMGSNIGGGVGAQVCGLTRSACKVPDGAARRVTHADNLRVLLEEE